MGYPWGGGVWCSSFYWSMRVALFAHVVAAVLALWCWWHRLR